MNFNPFDQKPISYEKTIINIQNLYPKEYDKNEVDAYTKVRCILLNGAEFEAQWFLHQFSRHCSNNDLRRELSLVRSSEQQQQKLIACLKPINQTVLETTIGYEQLAVDLTAILARREKDGYIKKAFDFALIEDFDHLYRYANLLEMEEGLKAEKLVGGYTEIMPGRPTIAEHRHPYDRIRHPMDFKTADLITKLNIGIIIAAEQQTMNYYMNICGFYPTDVGRRLYQEIALVEEQHVSQYESLLDTSSTWLERWLMHEYTECYLYYCCMEDESDKNLKKIWEQFLEKEIMHLHRAHEMLKKYENKTYHEVIPQATFPELIKFGDNIDYVRDVIKNSLVTTAQMENIVPLEGLTTASDFCLYNNALINSDVQAPSHIVIAERIKKCANDYRFELKPHPIPELRERKKDNTTIARLGQ